MEKIIYWFTRNHVAANFLMLTVVVLGVVTWPKLRKEIFPETAVDIISVQVPYPNAAPEEVEKGVCIPVEEAVADLDGIDRMTSTAAEGMGVIMIEVASGYDTRNIMSDVKSRVDAIDNFAEEAEKPIIEELLLKSQIMSVAVSADTDEKTLRKLAERVRDRLIQDEQITQAELSGVRDYEISIEVSEWTLREYGITLDDVANAVRASSLELPGGSVRTAAGETLIRATSKRYTAEEFEDIPVITRPDGSIVELREIATIIDGFEEVDIFARFDGRSAILVNVFRVGLEDTIKVADAVKGVIARSSEFLPEGVDLEIWNDTSSFLRGRLKLLAKNGAWGLLLVFIVLSLFLRPSLAFLVSIGIPVSFAGAIMLMPFTGISINMISLFAFILVLGIVVDDAIVVGENVFTRMRRGEHPRDAAPKGTHEVGVVVIFGVLTTMVAFTPMLAVSGVSGKIWPNIPLIVIPTLLFSLLQSKLVLPSHLAMLSQLDPHRRGGPIHRFRRKFTDGLETFVDRVYRPVLRLSLHNRYVVLSAFMALLAFTVALVATGWIRFQFFPEVEAEIIAVRLTMPNGVPVETTAKAVERLEKAALQLGEANLDKYGNSVIKHRLASVGSWVFRTGFEAVGSASTGDHIGEVTLELSPAKDRKLRARELMSMWRQLTGSIPGAVEVAFRTEAGAGGNAIDLEISGDSLKDLEAASEEIKTALGTYTGVIDISDSNRAGKRELRIESILPGAKALGLGPADVARQVRQAFYGEEAQRLQRGRDELKVMVRYPRSERESISNLEEMKIRTRGGAEVPFSEVAEPILARGYATIQRSDQKRAITIAADVDKTVKEANANEVVKALVQDVLPGVRKKFPGIAFKFQGEQKDQRQSVREIGAGALIALLVIYVLLAIPLRSYIQPAIVMAVIPFGLVGAVFGHILMGTILSIMSMCGIVALAGVVVNDSLVLVDFVNRHRDGNRHIREAVWEAGAARFRPILLTSLTTFAGLTPMLLETDLQAKFLIPMAISLAFGVMFATFITLLLVPAIYLILEDLKPYVMAVLKTLIRPLRAGNRKVNEKGKPTVYGHDCR